MMENAHPHENHRSRLRRRYLLEGLSHFEPHQVLELLLFYALRRRDTNPLAHALLSRFGNLGAVLAAEREALCRVRGIAERSADFFEAFRAVGEEDENTPVKHRYTSVEEIGALLVERFSHMEEESVLLLSFNQRLELVGEEIIHRGSIHSGGFSPYVAATTALLSSAFACIVAHNHRDTVLPRQEDLDITHILSETINAAGIRLLEHFVVSGSRYATLMYRYSGGVGESELSFVPPIGERPSWEQARLAALLAYTPDPDAAAQLLSVFGSLAELKNASPLVLMRRGGVKEATAVLLSLVAAIDAYLTEYAPVPPLTEGEALGRYFCKLYRFEAREIIRIFFFDRLDRFLSMETLSVGSVGEAGISCRRIAENAFFAGAHTAILVHNHPSGGVIPSDEDRSATDLARAALAGVGVALHAHYIVSGEEFNLFE